tara:strand:+ start:54 stop:236 length:183 start_codon:yes stop_codon:yes gene_type:complete
MCPEQIKTRKPVVSCDGVGGSLGHPLVYLNAGDKDGVDCPYCGKHYTLEPMGDEKGSGPE